MSEMAEAIRQLIQEKGYSEDSVKTIIENALKAAYKRTYGTADNAIVKFNDDMSDVAIYSRKTVVDGVYDPVTEIELEDAKKLSDEVELGDEIDILEDPKTFDRSAVTTGKQTAHQELNESYRDTLYNEYKNKIGEIVVCYYQYQRNGDIYVDLGNAGKLEGVLPLKFQSPREHYEKDDRIKALIVNLRRISTGLQVILSRSDPELVRSIIEMEVPEIADGTIEIVKIVRDAGHRTKIAVSSNREDVDPVGACVGLKGVRIQNVIRELLGEKIDVLKFDPDPAVFIKNALSPAQVERVFILDQEKRQALAIVEESQFSLAIGKQGQNVRLANKLCDWSIDVKTQEQAAEMDLSESVTMQTAQNLFSDDTGNEAYDEIKTVAELPGIDMRVAEILKTAGIEDIEQFVEAYDNDGLKHIEGLTESDIDGVDAIIKNTVEFVEAENAPESGAEKNADDEEVYHCPECGAVITLDMTHCPKCGVEFEFKEDEE
ncbi:transcription termination factor NusA [Treponema socranskii subsp. socranskii VPI DR56BR1116 = ATCC 35536]|uniref:Transcription termination/antitermination protein NusA n=1 Tax=Treponema socranskii subsp. socranskii VPI DR56BR1116 = ATCC 35536 TaxID=1125725 RepID=U2L722_TRESO|nr:transcription termination factor NusA [Treponema socranskii]ERF60625.1 transcription termination factor NusA [Treponema socranskii subsp. socranskii VPI DR56BR1116 = ATCC 35536]ERK00141.1 transcription termination factor NusA [Treponema socranskii subsp. socranskii VPI DR56BR1116 = ATCC 35536]